MAREPATLDTLRQTLGERYAVERPLGRGGMATVYRAEDKKHGRRVAVLRGSVCAGRLVLDPLRGEPRFDELVRKLKR